MKRGMLACAWASVVAIVVAFFLPWVELDVREPTLLQHVQRSVPGHALLGHVTKQLERVTAEVRRGAEVIVGELPSLADIPRTISGAAIPPLANQQKTKTLIALIAIVSRDAEQVGAKSYAVYLLPGIALLCGFLLTLAGRRPVMLGVAIVCAAIAGIGAWKVFTTTLPHEMIAVTIGRGLFLSLGGYAVLAASAALFALVSDR